MEKEIKQTKESEVYHHIIDTKVFPYLFNAANYSSKKTSKKLVQALIVLCFDDEIGQIAENVWPPNLIDKSTMKNLSGLGFPETNSIGEDGEMRYVFKIRRSKIYLIVK